MTLFSRSTSWRLLSMAPVAATLVACGDVAPPTELSPGAVATEVVVAPPTHPATGTPSVRLPVSAAPMGIAASSKGLAFVTQQYSNSIIGFRPERPLPMRTPVGVSARPQDVVFNKAGTIAWVATYDGGQVHQIDVLTNTVTRSFPVEAGLYRIVLSADESRLFVASVSGRLWSLHTHGDLQPTSVDLGAAVSGLKIGPSGDVYASTLAGGVYRLDPTTLNVLAQLSWYPWAIRDIAIAPDNSTMWFVAENNGFVEFLDPTSFALQGFITLDYWGAHPYAIEFTPDGTRAYVTSPAEGLLFIIERVSSNTFNISPLAVGGTPQHVAFSGNGAMALVSNESGGVDIIK
jgi:DNA-binding beta-propeller fold protein YncE